MFSKMDSKTYFRAFTRVVFVLEREAISFITEMLERSRKIFNFSSSILNRG